MMACLLVLPEIDTLRYGVADQLLGVLSVLVTDTCVKAVEQSDNRLLDFDGDFRLLVFLLLVLHVYNLLLLL